jgi:hypothetical protein
MKQADLADLVCEDLDCTEDHELFFGPRCHVEADVSISYRKDTGVLRVGCVVCDEEVIAFLIAI